MTKIRGSWEKTPGKMILPSFPAEHSVITLSCELSRSREIYRRVFFKEDKKSIRARTNCHLRLSMIVNIKSEIFFKTCGYKHNRGISSFYFTLHVHM